MQFKKGLFIVMLVLMGGVFLFAQKSADGKSKKPVILECQFNDFNVREFPDPNTQQFQQLSAGDLVEYLGQKTRKDFTYNLRGKSYTSPFIRVKLSNGKIGWVFLGGFKRWSRPRLESQRMVLYKHYFDELTAEDYSAQGNPNGHFSVTRMDDKAKFENLGNLVKVKAHMVYSGVSAYSEYEASLVFIDSDGKAKNIFDLKPALKKHYTTDVTHPHTAILLMQTGKDDLLIENVGLDDPYLLAVIAGYYEFDDVEPLNIQLDQWRKGNNAAERSSETYVRYVPAPQSNNKYLSALLKGEEVTLIPWEGSAQPDMTVEKNAIGKDWVLIARTNNILGWTQSKNLKKLGKANTQGPLITEYTDDLDI